VCQDRCYDPLGQLTTERMNPMRLWAAILVLAATTAHVHAQNRELSGPWGPMTEEAPAPRLANPAQGLTLVRRNQMRAISGHYRSIEAVVVLVPTFTGA
jgi:hypothetical protein